MVKSFADHGRALGYFYQWGALIPSHFAAATLLCTRAKLEKIALQQATQKLEKEKAETEVAMAK